MNTHQDWIAPIGARGVRKEAAQEGRRDLREHVAMLPFKALPLRVAKFDVALRERPLWAVRAKHTMLTRMALFTRTTCKNRFPAFHPAFMPPPQVKLDLLRPGADGLAPCNIVVA